MKRLIGTIICIFAIGIAVLSAAQGMSHDHGAKPMAMAGSGHGGMHDADHQGSDNPGTGHCEMLPGHCSVIAPDFGLTGAAVSYSPTDGIGLVNDRRKAKHRPETELRPPRV